MNETLLTPIEIGLTAAIVAIEGNEPTILTSAGGDGLAGLPFGHIPLNATLPVGVRATLDANNGDLIIAEAAVK